jgi:hypothetical protein
MEIMGTTLRIRIARAGPDCLVDPDIRLRTGVGPGRTA